MNYLKEFAIYVGLMFAITMILKFFGVLNITFTFIFSFLFIVIGLATVYFRFGKKDKPAIVIGTIIFLLGVLNNLNEHFFLMSMSQLYLPASLYIIGIVVLMLYIDEPKKVSYLFLSLFFISVPFFILSNRGGIRFDSIMAAALMVFSKYWLILLLAVISILFLVFQNSVKQEEKKENGERENGIKPFEIFESDPEPGDKTTGRIHVDIADENDIRKEE
ncbi:MAG: hypothetical protein HUU43_14730 [Ignavibacteriaceae bacterium]|nr:hypothetical protein [Ignavibacteriaceae bacterium]